MSWNDVPSTSGTSSGPLVRIARGRRRRAFAFGGLVALALGVTTAAALVLTDTLRIGEGARPVIAERVLEGSGLDLAPVEISATDCRSPLTPDDPLRLWIGGDSLAGSLGPALGERAAETGVVAPVYDSRVSSGLASPEFFDWPEHATEELERLDSEVVVFIIGANDWEVAEARPTDANDDPAWKAPYALAVAAMIDVLNGENSLRPVYWVGAPPMQDRRKEAGVREVNDVARDVVAEHPEAAYIDDYALFAGADGGYTPTHKDEDGDAVRVRAGDGVHFTVAGGELLGRSMFASLDERCRIDAQAVEGQDQRVVETEGSGRLPGGGTSSDGSGSGSGSTPTSPPTSPTTAAPPTNPPTNPPTDPPTMPPVITLPTG